MFAVLWYRKVVGSYLASTTTWRNKNNKWKRFNYSPNIFAVGSKAVGVDPGGGHSQQTKQKQRLHEKWFEMENGKPVSYKSVFVRVEIKIKIYFEFVSLILPRYWSTFLRKKLYNKHHWTDIHHLKKALIKLSNIFFEIKIFMNSSFHYCDFIAKGSFRRYL